MALACPDCSTELQDKQFYSIPIAVCPQCAGVWLDGDDLYRIRVELTPDQIEEIETEVTPPQGQAVTTPASDTPPCPVCHHPLNPYHYMNGPVVLHTCDNVCGIWVRDHELDKLAQSTHSQAGMLEEQKAVDNYDRIGGALAMFNSNRGWPITNWLGPGHGLFGRRGIF